MRPFVIGLALLLVSSFAAGCRESPPGDRHEPAPAPAPPPEPPAPPEDLAIHLALAPADRSLPSLRAALGGAADAWPRTFGGLVLGALDLPVTAVEVLSSDEPIALVVLGAAAGGPGAEVLVALPLRAPSRLEPLVAAGAGARFRLDRSHEGLVRLLPTQAGGSAFHLALVGSRLVATTSEPALLRAGRFAGLATPPEVSEGELAAATLGPRWSALARSLVARLAKQLPPLPGAAPNDGVPQQLGELAEIFAGGRLAVREEGGTVSLLLEAAPSPLRSLGVSWSLSAGPATPWLSLPGDAVLALLLHQGVAEREAGAEVAATTLADAVGLASGRREGVSNALRDLSRARGAPLALAFGRTPEGPAAWFRAGLSDVEAADRAVEALAVSIGKGSGGPGSISARKTVIERVGDAHRVRIRAGADPESRGVDLLVRRDGESLLGAVGLDAPRALRALREGEGASTLGAVPLAGQAATAWPEHVAMAYVDVVALEAMVRGTPRPSQRAPAVATLGRVEGSLRLRIFASPLAISRVHAHLAELAR